LLLRNISNYLLIRVIYRGDTNMVFVLLTVKVFQLIWLVLRNMSNCLLIRVMPVRSSCMASGSRAIHSRQAHTNALSRVAPDCEVRLWTYAMKLCEKRGGVMIWEVYIDNCDAYVTEFGAMLITGDLSFMGCSHRDQIWETSDLPITF
jgi:hypothetical protein